MLGDSVFLITSFTFFYGRFRRWLINDDQLFTRSLDSVQKLAPEVLHVIREGNADVNER